MTKAKAVAAILASLHKELSRAEVSVNKTSEEFWGIKDKIFSLTEEPQMKALVGKCFRKLNSYGSDTRPWYLFRKVLSYSKKHQCLVICSFQTTSTSRVEICFGDIGSMCKTARDLGEQITRKSFDANLRKAMRRLEKLRAIPVEDAR